jgi:hypothetical protein
MYPSHVYCLKRQTENLAQLVHEWVDVIHEKVAFAFRVSESGRHKDTHHV